MGDALTDAPPEALAVDAFEMRLVDIATVDLDQLHALSIGVGWPHRAEDWQFLRDNGHGIAALDEIGRVLGSAMWFPQGEAFATVGMVITSPRLQALGTGQWLMQHVRGECGDRALRLNATRAARRLYLSLDFQPVKTVYQCQGEAIATIPPTELDAGATLRALTPDDLEAAVMLDAAAYGARRGRLMAALLEKSATTGLWRDGRFVAFAFCRRFGRGHVIGPVVAATEAAAVAVVAPHVAAHAGTFLRLDTHMESGAFPGFVAACGLSVFDTVTTMIHGGRFADPNGDDPERPRTFALVSQAYG